ncbi:MAG: carboxylating nicotinate-nucleotide diphosphorylase [Desulfobulbaceae bacterium]|nr:carboxylating nicotinate-nucleotide diphosphorylase [Desulfobulbaceae bacterium]
MDDQFLRKNLHRFLAEDIGCGDLTSEAIFSHGQRGKALFIAKDDFILAGVEKIAPEVFRCQNHAIACVSMADGTAVKCGDIILNAEGPVLDLLKAERVALNLAQRLSGIATLTAGFVEMLKDLPVAVVDTRKTTPGLRVLEKYAVKVGGGRNHRLNLSDGILIKDNHIAACGSITEAVRRVREQIPHTLKIEVETENLDQVRECLECQVEIIMLDNMNLTLMQQAVKLINHRALVEASGGVNLANIRRIAKTGVDLISVGALTHSAPSRDISMRLLSS